MRHAGAPDNNLAQARPRDDDLNRERRASVDSGMKRTPGRLLAGLLVAVLAVGCGSDDGSGKTKPSPGSSSSDKGGGGGY